MASTIQEVIARWDSGEGKPYKGSLIDWSAYQSNPDDIGCMCAQGQILHLVAGWSVERLRDTKQVEADRETAALLGRSRGHAVLLRHVNDRVDGAPSIVLTAPEKVLGDQAHTVLAFWRHLDRMTAKDWVAARDAAEDAARATNEIQGARIMRERGQPFYFLPLFGFADPEAVLAADAAVL